MRRLWILAVVIGALVLAGASAWSFASGWAPSRARYPIQGIDVSEADGAIDWAMVKARNVDFVYARGTIGAAGRDARFSEYWAGLGEAGMRRGAIHVFSLCAAAAEQAGAFTATVPRDPTALPAAIDLDLHDDCPARPARQVVVDELRQLASIIETHSGKPVLLRVSPQFEAQYQVSDAIPRPVWAMRDFFEPDYGSRPWRIWRSSRVFRIDGVERPVSWNVVVP